MRGLAFLAFAVMAATAVPPDGRTETAIPAFRDPKERLQTPQLTPPSRLRFLTTVDFPPFNFLDSTGRLSGFHVDLARAICDELEIGERCQIQALPWEELESALADGQGEAIIAGLSVTAETRATYHFTRPYLQFPARFAMRKGDAVAEDLDEALRGRRVGVTGDSGHELFLRDFFEGVRPVVYTRPQWMLEDLKEGKIDAVFGDGMRLSFWLDGKESDGCCRFAGGPFLAPEYLGRGLTIAVPRDRPELAEALDDALNAVEANGTFAELYLRYFPISFY